jgi:phosphatidylglycerol---prolipoprotein diacylglyceryl transferase
MYYPDIDPVALDLGAAKIHWYGLMYMFAFISAWYLGSWRARKPNSGWKEVEFQDLLFYGALGVIIGGRFGYILFYDFANYIENPLNMFKIWQGGMSFHGGLLGVIIAMALFARKTNRTFFQVADYSAPLIPPGLFFGRIGNFINGELWGAETDSIFGMIIRHPRLGDLPARHPSQLYEAALEGLLLFIILWWFSSRPRPLMSVSGLFLLGYGSFRFLVEFVRLPDAHLGYLAWGWVTMGQVLSLPMIIIGAGFIYWGYRK